MQSKALLKSQKMPPTLCFSSSADKILCNNAKVALSVDKLFFKSKLVICQNIVQSNVSINPVVNNLYKNFRKGY